MSLSTLKNRYAKFKRGQAYPIFLGVFWAMAVWEGIDILIIGVINAY